MKSELEMIESPSSTSSRKPSLSRSTLGKPNLFQFRRTDDSDSEDEVIPSRKSNAKTKSSGACVHCKSLKVKCEFNPGEDSCQRCKAGNIRCQSRTRKKRKAAPTHEDLQAKSDSQDSQIQALLQKFDHIRTERKIHDLTNRAYSGEPPFRGYESQHHGMKIQPKQSSVEFAVASYFAPEHPLPTLSPPDIVKYCRLYPEDVTELFETFFEKINPFFSILDPALHTPQRLIWTCPFLFTAICSTASRYCTTKPGLYSLAKEFAREAAGQALVDGSKTVDICQAYLVLGVYPSPKKKWAEDRSWLFQGVAIRMALELELHLPPPRDCDEREALNRTRTWLNCYCVDGSHAIQFGKMPMLNLNDHMARTTPGWYCSSSMNTPYDVHLVAYVQILLIMAQWRLQLQDDSFFQNPWDKVTFALETEAKISEEWSVWFVRYEEELIHRPFQLCYYRGNTTHLITAYLRLVVLAVGFQYAFKAGVSRECGILKKSIDAAMTVIQIMVERLFPTGYLRYAMEANFLYVAFSAAYLINLLRPKLLPLLDERTQEEIINTVQSLIHVLSSKEVALDGRHTPALYSRFLVNLLKKYNTRGARSATPPDGVRFQAQYTDERHESSPGWPDIQHIGISSGNLDTQTYEPGFVYQQTGDADMDFSLGHFVQTVSEIPAQYNTEAAFDMGAWDDQWKTTSVPSQVDINWSSQRFPISWEF